VGSAARGDTRQHRGPADRDRRRQPELGPARGSPGERWLGCAGLSCGCTRGRTFAGVEPTGRPGRSIRAAFRVARPSLGRAFDDTHRSLVAGRPRALVGRARRRPAPCGPGTVRTPTRSGPAGTDLGLAPSCGAWFELARRTDLGQRASTGAGRAVCARSFLGHARTFRSAGSNLGRFSARASRVRAPTRALVGRAGCRACGTSASGGRP